LVKWSPTPGGLLPVFEDCEEKNFQFFSSQSSKTGEKVFFSGSSFSVYLCVAGCARHAQIDGKTAPTENFSSLVKVLPWFSMKVNGF